MDPTNCIISLLCSRCLDCDWPNGSLNYKKFAVHRTGSLLLMGRTFYFGKRYQNFVWLFFPGEPPPVYEEYESTPPYTDTQHQSNDTHQLQGSQGGEEKEPNTQTIEQALCWSRASPLPSTKETSAIISWLVSKTKLLSFACSIINSQMSMIFETKRNQHT